jgi:hypothetical protein
MEKGYAIMNHGVKFVECDKNKQMEGILEAPIKEPLEAMIKIEYIDSTIKYSGCSRRYRRWQK